MKVKLRVTYVWTDKLGEEKSMSGELAYEDTRLIFYRAKKLFSKGPTINRYQFSIGIDDVISIKQESNSEKGSRFNSNFLVVLVENKDRQQKSFWFRCKKKQATTMVEAFVQMKWESRFRSKAGAMLPIGFNAYHAALWKRIYQLLGGNKIIPLSELEKDETIIDAWRNLIEWDRQNPRYQEGLPLSDRIRDMVGRLIRDGDLRGRVDADRYIPNE